MSRFVALSITVACALFVSCSFNTKRETRYYFSARTHIVIDSIIEAKEIKNPAIIIQQESDCYRLLIMEQRKGKEKCRYLLTDRNKIQVIPYLDYEFGTQGVYKNLISRTALLFDGPTIRIDRGGNLIR